MKVYSNFKLPNYFDYYTEKYKGYPIVMYFDHSVDVSTIDRSKINIFVTHEPNELFSIHDWVCYNQDYFNLIITWNKEVLKKCPNAVEFQCSWRENDSNVFEFLGEKKFEVSYLCGVKDMTEGHKLRQKIYTELKDKISIPNKWYYVLDDFDHTTGTRPGYSQYSKDLSHVPSEYKNDPLLYGKKFLYENTMFNVGVENVKHPNWLNDRGWSCFASKVVPIYWGCTNLEDFGYDERGVIKFNNADELLNIINNLTEKDYYDRLPYIEYNYLVNKQDTLQDKLCYILDETIKLNNL